MEKYGKPIAAYASAFLISMVGLAWRMLFPNDTVMVLLAVFAFLPIPLLLLNLFLFKKCSKKIHKAKVADAQEYMLRHRTEAEKTSVLLLKKLQSLRHQTTVYTVLLWFFGACASLLGGMLYVLFRYPALAFGVLYGGTVLFAVYVRIRKQEPIVLESDAPVLRREEYPIIYDTASRAAQALDCRGEITILLSLDCNASIISRKNAYYLQIGVMLLSILSEEELFCIFLHEFSHCAPKNRSIEYEKHYNDWVASERNVPSLLANWFIYSDVRYMFNYMIYQYATSVVKETAADRDMATHGSKEAAASALLKLNYNDKFEWESDVYDEVPVYAAEAPNPNYIQNNVKKFREAIDARHAAWNEMLAKEILPNNASHPTLRMRFETLGVKNATCVPEESAPAYLDERQKVLDFAEKRLYEMQDTYEQDRKERYLEPLARITEWEENGMPILAETYADIIDDLKQLGRHEQAEALCERVIQELDESSSPHAYFIKGCALLYRYDEAGIDLVYHALETNHNYIDAGLEIIGTFFCMTGREKELLEYRERVKVLAQKDKDEYSETGFLSKNDRLSAEHMPDGMLEDILAYIRSVDGDIIQNIYLVRKTISESFFTSAFVIHFYGGTDAQRDEIMHTIFRYLDTYPIDWQFSLFDYFDYPQIKFDKIEGSLVFSKSNNKGEKQ